MRTVLAVVFALASLSAIAQDEKKDEKKEEKKQDGAAAPFGLPGSADLKTKCGLDDEQAKKIDAIYDEYKDKVADVQKKIDAGEKKGKKQANALKLEIIAKIHDLGKDDDQKKKIDEALPQPKKKKNAN
jgi:hypothetical protein